tara:strand:+ start:102 stop:365 length:264 start_codon:yes stop_codon:yes gene_type:complete
MNDKIHDMKTPFKLKYTDGKKASVAKMFKVASSPAKHTVSGDRAELHEGSYGKGHDNSKHPNYWKKDKEGVSRKKAEKVWGKITKTQ